jgi:hypothetical protein
VITIKNNGLEQKNWVQEIRRMKLRMKQLKNGAKAVEKYC